MRGGNFLGGDALVADERLYFAGFDEYSNLAKLSPWCAGLRL
jgi:hypothetical protein